MLRIASCFLFGPGRSGVEVTSICTETSGLSIQGFFADPISQQTRERREATSSDVLAGTNKQGGVFALAPTRGIRETEAEMVLYRILPVLEWRAARARARARASSILRIKAMRLNRCALSREKCYRTVPYGVQCPRALGTFGKAALNSLSVAQRD